MHVAGAGMKIAYFVNLSSTTNTEDISFIFEKLEKKYISMDAHGLPGIGKVVEDPLPLFSQVCPSGKHSKI